MRAYARAMRTNRTARPAARHARHAHRAPRPTLAAMLVSATVAAVVTILVTVAVVALACYLVGAPSAAPARLGPGPQALASRLLDPTIGRGAESQTCKHAPRSPRCLDGGGDIAVVRDHGAARPAQSGDDQTVLLGSEDVTGPARMPGRVPGRGGWVSEQGPSVA